jgi:hypothetical protein
MARMAWHVHKRSGDRVHRGRGRIEQRASGSNAPEHQYEEDRAKKADSRHLRDASIRPGDPLSDSAGVMSPGRGPDRHTDHPRSSHGAKNEIGATTNAYPAPTVATRTHRLVHGTWVAYSGPTAAWAVTTNAV